MCYARYVFFRLIMVCSGLSIWVSIAISSPLPSDPSDAEVAKEYDNFNRVLDCLNVAVSNGVVPQPSTGQGAKITVYRLGEEHRKELWFTEKMRTDMRGFKDVFFVIYEFKNQKIRYFFYMEDSVFRFISAYKEEDAKWDKRP